MDKLIAIALGSENACIEEKHELINGVLYEKKELNKSEEKIVRYLYESFDKFRLSERPFDKIEVPQSETQLNSIENTIVKPEIAVTASEEDKPTWIVEFGDINTDTYALCVKTQIYFTAGVSEYWVVDSLNKCIAIYVFEKNGLIPTIIDQPQRIKLSIYKTFFLSWSDMFEGKNKKTKK